jgi:hypothetical protein
MSWLPRVAEHTRERVSREFDNLGPEACVAEITEELRANNPEVLDMAKRCARDIGSPAEVMAGFGMFYRILVVQSAAAFALPCVTPHTRERILGQIDAGGSEAFTHDALAELERTNPELLQMAHFFASRQKDYLGMMQGFALIHACLAAQAVADRANLQ